MLPFGKAIFISFIIGSLHNFGEVNSQNQFISPTDTPTIKIQEHITVGTKLQRFVVSGTAVATDAWSITASTVCDAIYTIVPLSTNTRFADFQTKADVDFETANHRTQECTIRFRYAAGAGAFITKKINVLVTNKFDVAPTLPLTAPATKFTALCTEEEDPEKVCTMDPTPTPSDVETGTAYTQKDKLVCTVEGTTMFDVVEGTCNVRMKQTIDRDILATGSFPGLKLRVTDSGGNFVEKTLDVTVVDINDNAPTCKNVFYKGDILETSPQNSSFVTITGCEDKDEGDNAVLTYATSDTRFGVDNNGKVFITQVFDYDTIVDTEYVFRVFVADNATDTTKRKTFTATVSATILPVNEFNPHYEILLNQPFINAIPNVTSIINESPPGGTPIATLVATDADRKNTPHSTLTYSLISVSAIAGGNLLPGTSIDPKTGKIYITDPSLWDAEIYGGADIKATVCDAGLPSPLCNETIFRVTIQGVNEFAPSFIPTSGYFEAKWPEGTAPSTNLVFLDTDDPDKPDDAVTCTLSHSEFEVNGQNVRNKNRLNLDYNTNMDPVYSLSVECTDGPVSHKIVATVVITITPVNQHDPVITATPSPAGPYNEGSTAIGDTILTLSMNDVDYGKDGEVTCSISSPSTTPFVLDGCEKMRLGAPLDRELADTYTIIIDAVDSGETPRTGQVTVTVTVGDANDNSPVCNPAVYTKTLPEGAAASNFVQASCPDRDTHGVTYSLAVDYGGIFSIDATSGEISATAALDYETKTSYSLIVKSTDKDDASKTSTALVQVTVQNVNEQVPQVTDKSISMAEDTAPGTILTQMTITDSDTGTLGLKNVIVKEVKNNAGTIINSYFYIDKDHNVILMKPLDYEIFTDKVFVLTIEGEDGGDSKGTGELRVTLTDVNDNTPACKENYFTGKVNENLGADVTTGITVEVTDLDSGTNADPRFSIVDGDPNTLFKIDASSGLIKAAGSPALDYETATQHRITVEAKDKDGTGNSVRCAVVIDIEDLDDKPTSFSPSIDTIKVKEDSVLGTVLYSIPLAIDLDGTAEITYSIKGTSTQFYVDSQNAKLYLRESLDFETAETHKVIIVATETKSTDTAEFTLDIEVEDVNEATPICDPMIYTSYLKEDSATNTNIATLLCTDADTKQLLTCKVNSVDTNVGDDGGRFGMLGQVVKLKKALDYETKPAFVLEILCADDDPTTKKTGTATVTLSVIPVNEHTPVIIINDKIIDEGTAAGTLVVEMSASDQDKGLDHGPNPKFRIIGGNDNGYFRITDEGKIYVNKPPDRETEAVVTLKVQAYDGPGLTDDTTATITIDDINDNHPVFNPASYSLKVNEDAGNSFEIIDFAATTSDADIGNNADLKFELSPPNSASSPFSMTGSKLLVNGVLNVDTKTVYTLFVTATDAGTKPGPLSTKVPVVIEIIPSNKNVPNFNTPGGNPVSIPEDEPVGSVIFTANAPDTDNGLSGQVSYSITSGNTNDAFYINAADGKIQVRQPLDYDVLPRVYELVTRATDKFTPFNSASFTLTVSLTDVNDNDPVFSDTTSATPFRLTVTENNSPNFPVHTIEISDADSTTNGEVTVTLLSQFPQTPVHFSYDDTTKIISAIPKLDREQLEEYEVVLKAVDKAASPQVVRTTLQLYRITVIDENDNTPSFLPVTDGQTYYIQEQTGAVSGVVVGDFLATDPDKGINSNLIYGVEGIDPSSVPFVFVGTQLQSDTTGTLDRETHTHYILRLKANDLASPAGTQRTGCLTITVSLNDINDNTPVADPLTYSGTIAEDAPGGTVAATVLATDRDIGLNAKLKYFIFGGNDRGFFAINQQGAVFITVNGSLDREAIGAHILKVRVEDSGSNVRFIENVVVTVNVGDINDNRPIFPANPVRSIAENSAVGDLVGLVVTATDADTAENAALTYVINKIVKGVDHFQIDEVSAQVRVKFALLDREVLDTYLLELYAVDNGSPKLTGSVTLTISITDVNDNSPIIQGSYTALSVDENVPTGTNISQIVATDRDIGTNGQIRYTMIPGLNDYAVAIVLFDLDVNTGVLTAKGVIDRETYSSVTFQVMAQDQGLDKLNDTTIVTVNINDLNDFAPAVTSAIYNGEMAYKEDRLVQLVQVKATDGDATFNTVSYSITTSTTYLDISPTTGIVTHKAGSSTPGVNSILVRTVRAIDNYPVTPRFTDTLVRVDIYEPKDTVVCITFTLSESDFLSSRQEILNKLQSTLTFKYPTNRPGFYKHTVESDTKTKACFYVVANNLTDYTSQTATAKSFVPMSELLQYWRANSDGTPTSVLTSSTFNSYPITSVEPYDADSATTPLLWYQEPWGIAVITLLALLGALAIGLTAWGIYKCVTNKPVDPVARNAAMKHPPTRPLNNAQPVVHREPAPKVNGPKHLPNEVYYDKNFTKNEWKGTPSPNLFQSTPLGSSPTREPTPIDIGRINY